MRQPLSIGIMVIGACFFLFCCQKSPLIDSYAEVLATFEDPPADYRSAPLWVWNDRVTEEQIDTQLADFKAHGIGGVFIHPRPGLITPYLSDEWLELCRHAVDVGKSLGMKVWIYDENSYPSGFAGGHVPAEMPDSRGLGLRMAKTQELPASFEERPMLVLRRAGSGEGFEDITAHALQPGSRDSFAAGEYFVFAVQQAQTSPWFGGYFYVDIMRRDVTEKFIDLTLNAYKRTIGGEFGAAVPGSFQDEAHINPAGGRDTINFTPQLFDWFQGMWGYDLRIHLPSLFEETGDWKMVRHNYYATLLNLFIENWAKPYYGYCTANNLAFTGHYWEHEWPIPRLCPDNLAMAAYAHMPGIDCLMNQWATSPHAQFGNARAVKEIRSAANQLGRQRTMSETYGASGWDLTFYDQKRIADWEFALGVNFINQHLSYVTIMGARKRDHPLSFSYHEPWWHAYRIMGDYLGRMSAVMSKGEQRNSILVLEPTTTAWMHYAPGDQSEQLKALGENFQNFVNALEAAQVEYDLVSENTLKNLAQAKRKKLVLRHRRYDLFVLPPGLENLNGSTVKLLRQFLEGGGKVISLTGAHPGWIDGKISDRVAELAAARPKNWLALNSEDGIGELEQACSGDIQFSGIEGDRTMLFHHRRVLADAQIVFLANISSETAASGAFRAQGKSVETWDPFTGLVFEHPFERRGGGVLVQFNLAPGGSQVFCLRKEKAESSPEPELDIRELKPEGGLGIAAVSPNVLTIDYCDLRLGGREERSLYFYDAQRKIFKSHGLERNPWDSAVQFETNIIDMDKFAPNSGFEAVYWFTVTPETDLSSLRLVVERPALYRVSVNGRKVDPVQDAWWLDRAFGVFEIGSAARTGRNRIALRASPFTIHTELEPVYLLGNFFLETQDRGFKLVPNGRLHLGGWAEQGMPFYSGGVSYSKTVEIRILDPEFERYWVKLGTWRGAVVEVKVGDRSAGFIAFEPFELDVTNLLSEGQNKVSVIVYGTLKNTLGPHHNNPQLGTAWPGMFQKGAEGGYPPGLAYQVVGYGLFDDFQVQARTWK
jgi:hypothetical protein